jgi:hypothetical protein
MLLSSSRPVMAAVAAAAALAIINVAPAQAAAPASVTVRVEGLTETKLPPTAVTTSTAPVVKDGNLEHACAGTSAAGSLELATAGNWGGTWFGPELGYSVETILGESHLFESGSQANYFWSFWLDEHESQEGPCVAMLQSGDRVLFLPECFGEACPPGSSAPSPLVLEAPASANVAEAIPVIVKRYNAKGEAVPAAGATITGAAGIAIADSAGRATVSFASSGLQLLRASAPEAVRTETPVCVHSGNDGTCGTSAPGAAPSQRLTAAPPPPYRGPFAVVARVRGVHEHHVYRRRNAPRLLAGSATAHTAITSLSMSLRRSFRARCSTYSNTSARFVHARCGRDAFFRVSSSPHFSYLLPAPLRPGRYVFDLEATDAAGNHTTLARGTSRIVFYVR